MKPKKRQCMEFPGFLKKGAEGRFWEIDALRALAVLMMLLSNLITDLGFFGAYGIEIHSGFWWYFANATAGLFIFIAGLSLSLSYSKAKAQNPESEPFSKFMKRGAFLLALGALITLVTLAAHGFLGGAVILFGVLHLIGLSTILAYPVLSAKPFYRLSEASRFAIFAAFGVLLVAAGAYLAGFVFDSPYLLWAGARPGNVYMLDYEPLLPWFGVFLLGLSIGSVLYQNNERKFKLREMQGGRFIKPFSALGRHSLFVYLLHQPVIIAALYAAGLIRL